MGFGLLFIGYIFTYLLSFAGAYGCYPAIIGCAIMLYALTKLTEYEVKFKYTFFVLLPLTLCVGISMISTFCTMIGVGNILFFSASLFKAVIAYSKLTFDLFYNVVLLYAISAIALNTGIERTSHACLRNEIIYTLYFVLAVVSEILPTESMIRSYTVLSALILSLCLAILNLIVIFSCYMRICDENDQDMKRKESKIGFVNDLRKEFDRREEKAHNQYREYKREKAQKRINKLNANKKSKNK